jgi:hypothetical protein
MIGTPASANFFAHSGVELRGLLGSDRQVADEHVGLRVLQHLDHVGLGQLGLGDHVSVVGAQAVERATAVDLHARVGHVGEPDRVVRLGQDGLGDVGAHLLGIDVERGHDLDVADVVAAQLDVHQAGDAVLGIGVLVVLQALYE